MLGIIFSERLRYQFTDPAAPAFLGGVAAAMEDSSLGLLLIPDSRDRDRTAANVQTAAVDGFVIYSTVRNDPRVEAALGRQLPVVTVDQPRDAPTPFIGIDDRDAARTAAAHLRRLGHSRVAVLSFIRAIDREGRLELELTADRLAGYEDGLGEAWDENAVRTCRPNAPEPARRATLDLLQTDPVPTAILAMSDVLALGALQAAAEVGIRGPDELSIVGFDDSPAAELATPALTTVAQPFEEKGRLAAEQLIDAVEHGRSTGDDRRRTILPTELVVRDSTAPRPEWRGRAVKLVVNTVVHELAGGPEQTLLSVLREQLGLTAAKPGCGEGVCGACTVLVGGEPVCSCVTAVGEVEAPVTTLEGLAPAWAAPSAAAGVPRAVRLPVRLLHAGDDHVGSGAPGQGARPDEATIAAALEGNVCRCCTYPRIVRAARRATELEEVPSAPMEEPSFERPSRPWDLVPAPNAAGSRSRRARRRGRARGVGHERGRLAPCRG